MDNLNRLPLPKIPALLSQVTLAQLAGTQYPPEEKRQICETLFSGLSSPAQIRHFHHSVNAPRDGRVLYPLFFIPPFREGKKMPMICGYTPKTQLLSTNSCELETLRLLALWAAEDTRTQAMLQQTLSRLKSTCFGHFCAMGECFECSLVTLRFLCAAAPQENAWIQALLTKIWAEWQNRSAGSRAVHAYYWLVLSECPLPRAKGALRAQEALLSKAAQIQGVQRNPFIAAAACAALARLDHPFPECPANQLLLW